MIDNRKEVDSHIAKLVKHLRVAQRWKDYQLENVIMKMIGHAAAIRIGPIEMLVRPDQVFMTKISELDPK